MSERLSRLMPARLRQLIWPLMALAALLLFNGLFTDGFARVTIRDGHAYGSLVDILKLSSRVMLVSLGMTLVIATAGVDLSVGAVVAIAGSVAARLIVQQQIGLPMALAATSGLCLVLGAWNGTLVGWLGVQPIVATLILMVAGRGIAQLLAGGQIITVESSGFSFIAGGYFLGLPFPVTMVALMLLLTVALTRGTALGLFIEAVGNNETAALFAGVNPCAVKMFAYAFTGLCSGMAGIIEASDIKAADANNAGLYLELDVILAVVIGGTPLNGGRFDLAGSLVGALIIQTLTTTIKMRGVPVEYTLVVKAVVVLVICLAQSPELRKLLLQRRASA
ncbi:MAG: sugar ABC transporter permease [Verrucomicrobia bacterium]|nr:MAG: sugar ABC transporter permease [Verrucomicrobiota bacterium]